MPASSVVEVVVPPAGKVVETETRSNPQEGNCFCNAKRGADTANDLPKWLISLNSRGKYQLPL